MGAGQETEKWLEFLYESRWWQHAKKIKSARLYWLVKVILDAHFEHSSLREESTVEPVSFIMISAQKNSVNKNTTWTCNM